MTSKIELQATVKTLQALYSQEAELKEAIKNKDLLIIATPTGAVDDVTKKMKDLYDGTPICAISKGIEQDTCLFVYDVIKKYLDTDEIAIMSGPSFAIDVANKVPIGLTLAGNPCWSK